MEIELSIHLDNGREVWLNASVKSYDDGIGEYEYWGSVRNDRKIGFEVIKVTHDEDLTDDERKQVEEYLESNGFQEKIGEILECH